MIAAHAARWRRYELLLVIVASLAVLAPGIGSYTLVDPWETHYGEVAREMLEYDDFIHTKWSGTSNGNAADREGFRSKPVLSFWLMAASMRAFDVGDDGGYSGEMTQDAWTMVAVRLPFILCAIAGLTMVWWMLARVVSRRLAWLALLVVGSTPMFCLIARNAIPDMPMVACTMGAFALLVLALEDGDRPIVPFDWFARRRIAIDARHVVLGLAGGCVLVQAIYFAFYFTMSPQLAVRGPVLAPAVWIPLLVLGFLAAQSRDGWTILRVVTGPILIGGVIAAVVAEPLPARKPGKSLWRHVFDDIFGPWDRHAVDRYALQVLPLVIAAALAVVNLTTRVPRETNLILVALLGLTSVIWVLVFASRGWPGLRELADRLLAMSRLTTMRQLFLIGAYFLLGASILAKGPPGMTVIIGVAAFHVALFWRWRVLWDGGFEIKRGLLLMAAVAVPWHAGMYFKEGARFIHEYIYTHIINRAAANPDKSLDTFEMYAAQIGHGMWLWAALIPAALAAAFVHARRDTREGRVRYLVGLWAILAVFLFCFVETKFHHYILPAIPPLGILVAFFLDDLLAKRERLHAICAALGAGIVLLVCRDLMHEPERWVEMFVFRYDRPWPSGEPWQVDVSDGILGLGVAGAIAIVVAACRLQRIGVAAVGVVGLAICVWALQVYMPRAGKHWGMREAMRAYYEQRTVYGHKTVVFGAGQCVDEWSKPRDTWQFETFIPDALQVGQPMTITLQVNSGSDERIMVHQLQLVGTVTRVGHHDVTLQLHRGERDKHEELVASCKREVSEYERRLAAYAKASPEQRAGRGIDARLPERIRGRPVVRAVDADRLIAWQLYWRGEQFWSGGEIWQWLPEMKTSFPPTPTDAEFKKYINDRSRSPLGRRYFVITDAGRIHSLRSTLPTQRARESLTVLDTTSNKFTLAAFDL